MALEDLNEMFDAHLYIKITHFNEL